MMYNRPMLLSVRIIPWEMDKNLFGVACQYDDGVTDREMWGTYEETMLAVGLRQREVVSQMNLKSRLSHAATACTAYQSDP